jgi:hypothetical protein
MITIVGYRPLAIDYEVLPPFLNTYSLAFDGMDDEVTTSSAIVGSDITLSYWVNCNSTYAANTAYFPISIARSDASDANNQLGRISLRGANGYVGMQSYDENNTNYSNYFCRSVELVGTEWHNIVLTWNNSTKHLYCYIDGAVQTWSNYGNTVTTSFLNYSTFPSTVLFEHNLRMAKGLNGTTFFGGLVDEVATFDSVLSSEDITNIYGVGAPSSLASLSPIAWYRMGDNGSYKSPQWLIPSDENNDEVSNYSMDFDGLNDRVVVGDTSSFNFVHETGIFTMSYWLRLTDYTTAGVIRISGNNGTTSARNGFEFDYNQVVGERRLRLRITVNPLVVILSATAIDAIIDNDWHNVIISGDGTNVFFTIDGVTQTGSGTMSNLAAGDADYPLSIGSVNGYTPNPMNGDLDEVAFFDSNIVDKSLIYSGGIPTDLTALNPVSWYKMGENAKYKSPQWLIPSDENKDKVSNYSMKFSGGGQIIDIGTGLDLGINSTVSFWVKRGVTAVNEAWFGEATYTSDYFAFMTSAREFYVRIGASAYVGWTDATVKTIFNNTTDWINVIIIRSGDTMELFLNGAAMAAGAPTGTPGATVTRFDTIGAKPGLGNSTNAKFAEVAAWNTNTIIPADIFNGGTPTTIVGATSYWKLGENATYNGSVWTVPDEVGANNGTSVNMVAGDRIGEAPDSVNNGVSSNMTIEDRIGESPNTTNNALSYNMIVLDRVPETP